MIHVILTISSLWVIELICNKLQNLDKFTERVTYLRLINRSLRLEFLSWNVRKWTISRFIICQLQLTWVSKETIYLNSFVCSLLIIYHSSGNILTHLKKSMSSLSWVGSFIQLCGGEMHQSFLHSLSKIFRTKQSVIHNMKRFIRKRSRWNSIDMNTKTENYRKENSCVQQFFLSSFVFIIIVSNTQSTRIWLNKA